MKTEQGTVTVRYPTNPSVGHVLRYSGEHGWQSKPQSALDHGSIGGLNDDDHSRYFDLGGRGAGSQVITPGAAAAAVAMRFGATVTEGLEIKVIDETVTCSPAAASFDLTENIPAGAVILSVQANLQTVITAVTAVKVGIGVTADPDKYGKTSGLTKNLKVDTIPAWTVLAAEEDVKIFAVDTAGAAAGTIGAAAQQVRVRIVYLATNSLDDAA